MSLSGSLRTAMTFGLGLLLAACAEEPAAHDAGLAPEVGGVGALVNDPAGTTGTNNLSHIDFHNNQGTILEAMKKPLLAKKQNDPNVIEFNEELYQSFASKGQGGLRTLAYVAKCALPPEISIKRSNGEVEVEYKGEGVFDVEQSQVDSWWWGPIDLAARPDVLACMAAHVNAYNVEVPIGLQGTGINGDIDLITQGFAFEEAFWGVEIVAGRAFYHVWPLPGRDNICNEPFESKWLKDRLCGVDPVGCLFVAEENPAECVDEIGNKSCKGMRIIKTRLKVDDVPKLYPECIEPQ